MNYSLYFHIPFCRRRCYYCDFNTCAGKQDQIPAYVSALCREISIVADAGSQNNQARIAVHSLYFGGGTPSLIPVQQYEVIFKTIQEVFDLSEGIDREITLEANPGTLSREYSRDLHSIGFNRISLGVQSAHLIELRQLGRIHDFNATVESVEWVRQSGFVNLNLDLIYGLPGQKIETWRSTLESVSAFQPEHLSLYALTIEPGTPFGRWASHGLMPLPDPDQAAEMYERAAEYLDHLGYEQYEISNWARPGCESRHNLQYWRNLPYLGFGAGAHGYANHMRVANVLKIGTYIRRCNMDEIPATPFPASPAAVSRKRVTIWQEMSEHMLTGLRLTREGVSEEGFKNRFKRDLQEVFGEEIEKLVGFGLLEWCEISNKSAGKRNVRLTRRGRLLGNQVFIRFV